MISFTTSEKMAGREPKDCVSGFTFTLDLMKHCTEGNDDNVFISPFSISVALGMTLAGAREMTADQMKNVLKLESLNDDAAIHEAFKSTLNSLSTVKELGLKLHLANRMYVKDKENLLPEFEEILNKTYSVTSVKVDFGKDLEKIRLEINKWVEEETDDKIKDLIGRGMLKANSCLVLINAIYFKGDWAEKFYPQNTEKKDFFVNNSKRVTVDMMYKKEKFRFGRDEELQCQILELPYANGNLGMYILLPMDQFGLQELEGKLTDQKLNTLLSTMNSCKVHVSIPKFKVETSLSLVDTLKAMGMRDVFNVGKADLSGITGSRNLYVSEIVHKAFLEINEEGSEAAAATAVLVIQQSYSVSFDPVFTVDHPFILFIRDNSTGNILFWGKIINPS